MTPENQIKYDEKLKRINDAIALREPDRVPMTPSPAIFPVFHAGYTMTDAIYDDSLEVGRNALLKYLRDFDPDCGATIANYIGEGRLLELQQPTTVRWSGMPGNPIGDKSLHQFIEFPILLDDEIDDFFHDRTSFLLRKALPRTSDLLKPLSDFHVGNSILSLAGAVSGPDMRQMIQTLWEISDGYAELFKKRVDVHREIEEAGYPLLRTSFICGVPFDEYSDFYRGTLLSLADLYERPEEVRTFIDEAFEHTIALIRASKGKEDGKHVFMALHKGMDGFMGDEHYREYYWDHLQKIICEIIDVGKVPYIFTEGKYNSRLDCLKEVPPGKVFYHFEEVDMAEAKRKLGDVACISGGFSTYLLNYGTKQQVIDECKRLIDICAPGGGFIFETACGMDYAKEENVEAMFDTVRNYGKK